MIELPERYAKRVVELPRERRYMVYMDYGKNLLLGTVEKQSDAIKMLDTLDRRTDIKKAVEAAFNKGSGMKADEDEKEFEKQHAGRVEQRLEDMARAARETT